MNSSFHSNPEPQPGVFLARPRLPSWGHAGEALAGGALVCSLRSLGWLWKGVKNLQKSEKC